MRARVDEIETKNEAAQARIATLEGILSRFCLTVLEVISNKFSYGY